MLSGTETHDVVHVLTRWTHVVAGVIWIGQLYFLNFVHAPAMAALDRETKRKVLPELLPRILFWFRWGAAWTWGSGLLLLSILYWEGPFFARSGVSAPGPALAAFLLAVALFWVYDLLATRFARHALIVLWSGYAIAFGYAWLLQHADFFSASNRAVYVHTGALLGTLMAANVWIRIWPAQQRILAAIVEDREPDPADVARAALRSRHNTHFSVPLLFLMLAAHEALAGVTFGEPWVWILFLFGVGFLNTLAFYARAKRVKGSRA